MLVISCSPNSPYCLAEVDGTISKLKFAAFQLIPYHPHSPSSIEVTCYLNPQDLEGTALDSAQMNFHFR
jgi:hypothetical protein